MALFIFGAGATRGASFVDINKNPCLPPLDADFFTQLQRMSHKKHQEIIDEVITKTHELFGPNFGVTLETLFSTIEQTKRIIKVTTKSDDSFKKKVKNIESLRNYLLSAICAVFEESMCEWNKKRISVIPSHCKYHEKFVKEIVEKKDVIISFNYDCLLDYSLKNSGGGKWNPRFGYGFSKHVEEKVEVQGHEHWKPTAKGQKVKETETVRLYKLHGSLNFQARSDEKLKLKQVPYSMRAGDPDFLIIPPESNKTYDDPILGKLWRSAYERMDGEKVLVVIGYSVPATDLHASALLRLGVPEKLKSLVVVNPDKEARYRIREILKHAIADNTRVHSFDTFEQFVSIERSLWDVV